MATAPVGVLGLTDQLDVDTARSVEEAVTRLLDGQCTPSVVALDLSDRRFVDVAGLSVLAGGARRSGWRWVCGGHPNRSGAGAPAAVRPDRTILGSTGPGS